MEFSFIDGLKNNKFFITGATGLIGTALVRRLTELDRQYGLGLRLYCFVRNECKARRLFGNSDAVNLVIGDFDSELKLPVCPDYILHCASPTDSRMFITNPTETYWGNIEFVKKLIDKFCDSDIKGLVYLSSLEVYGTSETPRILSEDSPYIFNSLNVRNSYPLAKIASEELLFMSFKQFGLPVKIARLTQTFGRGVSYDDKRVFAQFARSVAEDKDIILNSYGATERNYCSVDDAVNALLFIALNGVPGEAYNVAGDHTSVSILKLAELFCNENKNIKIKFDIKDTAETGYLNINKVALDNAKLKGLGWKSEHDIKYMVKDLCDYFKELKNDN